MQVQTMRTAELSRRPAVADDVAFLLQLRRETMSDHMQASGADCTDDEHLRRLHYRFDCAEILLLDGVPVGLLKLARDAGEWEIIQIQLSAATRGRGAGSALLASIIDEATRADADVMLKVLKANPARRLYQRLGFVVVGEDGAEYRMHRAR